MRAAKILIIMVMVASMLAVWPIRPFREVGSVRSGDEGHSIAEPLEEGESITQTFKAADNNIIQLEYVFTYDETMPREGELLFELLDKEGNVLYEETVDYGQVPNYSYNGSILNLKLKKGRMYSYRLTNLSVTDNKPCGVYTTDKTMYGIKKGSLNVAGENVEGELLTRITANKPLTAENTLAVWGCIGLVGFSAYELLDRIQEKNVKQKDAKRKDVNEKEGQ
jgi:hypothetical protein